MNADSYSNNNNISTGNSISICNGSDNPTWQVFIMGLGIRGMSLSIRVWGLGFRAQGLGFKE